MLDTILVVCLAYSTGEEMQEFTDTNDNPYTFTDYLKAYGMFQCQYHLYIITKTENVNYTVTELI